MYNYELSDSALRTWIRLRQASGAMEKVLEKDLDKRGSTPEQLDVLATLDAMGNPTTPGYLSDYLFREKHSMSAQLSRMCKAGMVKKTRSKKDQRVVRVVMTAKGKQRLTESKVVMGQAREIVTSALSEQELVQFDGLLRKVRDKALEKMGQKAEALPEAFDVARYEGTVS